MTTAHHRRSRGSRTGRPTDRGWRRPPSPTCAAPSTCPIAVRPRSRHGLPLRPSRLSTHRGADRMGSRPSRSVPTADDPLQWRGAKRRVSATPSTAAAKPDAPACRGPPTGPARCPSGSVSAHRPRGVTWSGCSVSRPTGRRGEHPRRGRCVRTLRQCLASGAGQTRRRSEIEPTLLTRFSDTPHPANSAGGRRQVLQALPGIRWRRMSSGISGRTDASPARAADPHRAVGWPATDACPSERPSRPIATNNSAKSGCWLSNSENSSTTMNSAGSGGMVRP